MRRFITKTRSHTKNTNELCTRRFFVTFVVSWLRDKPSCCGLSRGEVGRELFHRAVQAGLQRVVQLLLLDNPAEQVRVTRLDELVQLDLEHAELGQRDVIEITVGAGINDRDLTFD